MAAIRRSRGRDLGTRRSTGSHARRSVDPFPELTIEEAEARLNSRPNLLAMLTPEQVAFLDGYDGPENVGPSARKRKHP